jgi:hypothetical protein
MLSGERMKLLQKLSSFLHFVKENLVAGVCRRQPGSKLRFEETTRFGATRMLLLCLSLASSSSAQQAQPSEYQIKAAFIFNFAKFVEWPAAAFADEKSPLCIGVFGDNPFGADLERFIRDKTINDHPLTMRECPTLEEAKKCHILFISASEKTRLREIFKTLQGANVLTVSETDGFTEMGGMVNFVSEGNKIRFQIDDGSAKSVGLKISAKLLSLAAPRRARAGISPTTVREPGQPPRRLRQSGFQQAADSRSPSHSTAPQRAVAVPNSQLLTSDADENSA